MIIAVSHANNVEHLIVSDKEAGLIRRLLDTNDGEIVFDNYKTNTTAPIVITTLAEIRRRVRFYSNHDMSSILADYCNDPQIVVNLINSIKNTYGE